MDTYTMAGNINDFQSHVEFMCEIFVEARLGYAVLVGRG